MKKNELREVVYQRYQLQWMLDHGKSLDSLKQELKSNEDMLRDVGEASNVQTAWEIFEETGFHGEMYSCYNEFLVNELQDIDYMKSLLNKEEFEVWKVVRFAGETDTFAEFSITGDYGVYTLYIPEGTDIDKADISALIEYTLHAILDNGGSGQDVRQILGFRKVKSEVIASADESDSEYTFTDLCFMANGYIERIWEENKLCSYS